VSEAQPLALVAVPGGGSHWKVVRGSVFLGWVHRLDYRRWVAKRPDGSELPEAPTRRDALALLEAQA
jgi:hypothetical protein